MFFPPVFRVYFPVEAKRGPCQKKDLYPVIGSDNAMICWIVVLNYPNDTLLMTSGKRCE